MNAHSTAVAIIDIELDLDADVDIDVAMESGKEDVDSQVGLRADKLRDKLRRLQADHVWIREKVTHLQRRLVTQQLDRQRRAFESKERMLQLLGGLQVKYGRDWGL